MKKSPTAEGAKEMLDKYSEIHPGTKKSTKDFFAPEGLDSGLLAQLREKKALQKGLLRVAYTHPEYRADILPVLLENNPRLMEAAGLAKTQDAAKRLFDNYVKLHPKTQKTVKDFLDTGAKVVQKGKQLVEKGKKVLEKGKKIPGQAIEEVKGKHKQLKEDVKGVGKALKEDVQDTAKDVGKTLKKDVEKVKGVTVGDVAKGVGETAKSVGKGVGETAKSVGKGVGQAAKKVVKKKDEAVKAIKEKFKGKGKKAALKRQLIRVAHANPEFRKDLLPLILED